MKVNKTIIIGTLFILLAGIIFLTNALNPIIRPVTYFFLMGSSKGKDILFFGLLGLFLISSQLIKKDINTTRYLKISIILGAVLLILGILLEVIFRLQMGIGLNTVFCSMTNGMSTTSILHTHLLKSILGEVITQIIGPFIQSDINTGVGLYAYLPNFAFLVILLVPVLFITTILSIQKHTWFINFLIAFFSSCLLIGIMDGGMFATPSYLGFFGLLFVYLNEEYINYVIGNALHDKGMVENESSKPIDIINGFKENKFTFKDFLIWIAIIAMIILRFTIAFAGAEPDYYTVDVANPADNIDLGNISTKIINFENNPDLNKTTYHIDPKYNEMELINDLKVPLNNSCEYYTVSWNIYSY
jgi:hypothetical protein